MSIVQAGLLDYVHVAVRGPTLARVSTGQRQGIIHEACAAAAAWKAAACQTG